VETINDPKNLHLDHQRYYKWPENPFRSYDPISIFEAEETTAVSEEEKTKSISKSEKTISTFIKKTRFSHAAKQCMSFYANVGNTIDGKI
jgi:hypothetical protein